MAEMLELDRPGGIIIAGLHPASPLAEAGFAVGDVVLSVDGAEVHSPGEMLFHMGLGHMDGSVVMTRLRDGELADLTVAMRAPPEDPPRDAVTLPKEASLPELSLARINPAIIAEMRLPLAAEGVVVTELGALGGRVGLRVGDILQTVEGQDITVPSQAADALAKARRGTRVRALRGGTLSLIHI